jgi:hypothetical protein
LASAPAVPTNDTEVPDQSSFEIKEDKPNSRRGGHRELGLVRFQPLSGF